MSQMDTNPVTGWLYDCKQDVKEILIMQQLKSKSENKKGEDGKLILGMSRILFVTDCYILWFRRLDKGHKWEREGAQLLFICF